MAADDGLLRRLDLDSKRPYPVKAEQLTGLVAYVEASPGYLSRRMETLEARLTGDQRVVPTGAASSAAWPIDWPAGLQIKLGSLLAAFPYEFLK